MSPRPTRPPPIAEPPASPLTRRERAELEELRDATRRDGVKVKVTVNSPGLLEDDHWQKCPRCGSRFDVRDFEAAIAHLLEECAPVH